MPQTVLGDAIIQISNTGFFDYALPFIVTFAVLYGILERTSFFGKKNRRIDAFFSLIVSLMILPFAASVNYTTYLSKLVFVIVKFVAFAMVMGLLGFDFEKEDKKYALFGALAVTLLIVITEFFDVGSLSNYLSGTNMFYAIIMIFVFGLVFWAVTGSTKPNQEISPKPKETKQKKETPQQIPPQIPRGQEQIQMTEDDLEALQEFMAKRRSGEI